MHLLQAMELSSNIKNNGSDSIIASKEMVNGSTELLGTVAKDLVPELETAQLAVGELESITIEVRDLLRKDNR